MISIRGSDDLNPEQLMILKEEFTEAVHKMSLHVGTFLSKLV